MTPRGRNVMGAFMEARQAATGFLLSCGVLPELSEAVTERLYRVVHQLSALAGSMRKLKRGAALTNRLRTEGTDHLLSAGETVGVQRFVAQSHILSYARTGGSVKSEEDPFDPAPAREMCETLVAIRHLEEAVLGARWTEGIVLRYGHFDGPGTSLAPGAEQLELVRRRKFPLVGDGGGGRARQPRCLQRCRR